VCLDAWGSKAGDGDDDVARAGALPLQRQDAGRVPGAPGAPGPGRIAAAGEFYRAIKPADDPWDFGDSDNAWVTPFFADETRAAQEWHAWFDDPSRSLSIGFWWPAGLETRAAAAPPAPLAAAPCGTAGAALAIGPATAESAAAIGTAAGAHAEPGPEPDTGREPPAQLELAFPSSARAVTRRNASGWEDFPDSGYAMRRVGGWRWRWDLSPLGFLATAAHGHLDALHLSLWLDEVPWVIDPGTGAYYADRAVREHLASWAAHNGPHVIGLDRPQRHGTFLWGPPHPPVASLPSPEPGRRVAELTLPGFKLARAVAPLEHGSGLRVTDSCHPDKRARDGGQMCVCWRFAPDVELAQVGACVFRLSRAGWQVRVELDPHWAQVEWMNPNPAQRAQRARTGADLAGIPAWGWCAPAFRELRVCPFLRMRTAVGSGRTAGVAFALERGAGGGERGADDALARGGPSEPGARAHGA
jgi:hypothetical protein